MVGHVAAYHAVPEDGALCHCYQWELLLLLLPPVHYSGDKFENEAALEWVAGDQLQSFGL